MKSVKYKKMLKALRQSLANLNLENMPVSTTDYRLVKRKITKRIIDNNETR